MSPKARLAPGLARARVRLTALYAALFAGSGGALLLVVNLLARRSLPEVLIRAAVGRRGEAFMRGPDGEPIPVPFGPFPSDFPSEGFGATSLPSDFPTARFGPTPLPSDFLMQRFGPTQFPDENGVWIHHEAGIGPVPGGTGRALSIANAATITTAEYLRWSLLVFAALLAASIVLGFLLSGRVLAPIQRSFDSERRLVATMSHELRTPLAIQRALLETTIIDTPGALAIDDAAHDDESPVLEQNIRATRIIDAMLTLARASRGQVDAEASMEEVDLSAIVRQVVEARKGEAMERGIELRLGVPETRMVRGDAALLERLVDNLLVNAIVHNIDEGWVHLELGEAGGGATNLTIGNSGALIDPADVSALLQPFRRGSRDRTGSARGTGLGLTIASEVAEFHAGTLSLSANPGGGLTATVVLP
ncbi:MAG: HAMP domain-containing histidine kinase [Micrococcales bacterium]|nr:HAMP domain-containing histidine kinase [Micrococcales bacterium]